MKKIKYLLFTVLLLVISLVRVNAASISVSAGKNVTVGSNFKVNVKVSGAAGWEYCLSYDERYFSYVSSNSDTGGLCVKTGSTLTGYADVTYNFKAIAAGTGAFTINSGNAYDDDGNVLETSKGSVNVVVVAQKELNPAENQTNNYSDNANLKSLEVVGYSLTPEFDKNTTTYSLEVENEVTKVAINAYRDDVTSSISSSASDTDNIELTEGLNKITFTVTAQKGNRKVYTINITRKDVNPIVVTVDGIKYTLVRDLKDIEAPLLYNEGTVKIDETEVPAYVSETTGYSLVVLKDNEGNTGLFRYDNGVFVKYVQLTTDNLVLIPENTREEIAGYTKKKEIVIDNNDVVVYVGEKEDFVLLYARNVKTGESSWYKYDTKEGTFQRYDATKGTASGKDIYFFLTIVFAVIAFVAILIMLLLSAINGKLRKKNQKLVDKLKNKQVTVIEHPVFDTDIMKVDSWKDIKTADTKKKRASKAKDTSEETIAIDEVKEETEEVQVKPIEEKLEEEASTEEIPVEETVEEVAEEAPVEEEPKEEVKLTKRELKKKEKEERKALEKELKAMRDDFLNTLEVPQIAEEEEEIEVPDLDDLTDTQVMNLTDTQIMDFSKTQQLEIKKRRRKRKRKAKES